MNCLHFTRKKPLKEWIHTPIKYESNVFVKDILDLITNLVHAWILKQPDLEFNLTYDSFRQQYIQLLYYGYQTKHPVDTMTDYFDLKYLEDISDIHRECMEVADHYQLGLKSDMMDTLEYIRDHVMIYDPDQSSEEEDSDYNLR